MLKTRNNKEEEMEDSKEIISLADLQLAAAANTPEPLRTIGLFGDLDEEKVEDICSGLLYLKHTANVNTDFPLGKPEDLKEESEDEDNRAANAVGVLPRPVPRVAAIDAAAQVGRPCRISFRHRRTHSEATDAG